MSHLPKDATFYKPIIFNNLYEAVMIEPFHTFRHVIEMVQSADGHTAWEQLACLVASSIIFMFMWACMFVTMGLGIPALLIVGLLYSTNGLILQMLGTILLSCLAAAFTGILSRQEEAEAKQD